MSINRTVTIFCTRYRHIGDGVNGTTRHVAMYPRPVFLAITRAIGCIAVTVVHVALACLTAHDAETATGAFRLTPGKERVLIQLVLWG